MKMVLCKRRVWAWRRVCSTVRFYLTLILLVVGFKMVATDNEKSIDIRNAKVTELSISRSWLVVAAVLLLFVQCAFRLRMDIVSLRRVKNTTPPHSPS